MEGRERVGWKDKGRDGRIREGMEGRERVGWKDKGRDRGEGWR